MRDDADPPGDVAVPPTAPFLLRPVYQNYLWGGSAFRERLGRDLPAGVWAESWEVSGHPDGVTRIETGALAGLSLNEAAATAGRRLLGTLAKDPAVFPLLIKVLDAALDLSVQVHPNDASAAAHGGEPKTEMWHLLDARPGARVLRGWNEGFTLADYDRALAAGEGLAARVRPVPVAAGDTLFIPGGLVHAIGAGCLILEVQQASNTTFRMDDWGRTGPDGRPRELHTGPARNHLRFDSAPPDKTPPVLLSGPSSCRLERLQISPYFEMRRITPAAPVTRHPADATTFRVWFSSAPAVLRWNGGELSVPAWRSVFIPAGAPDLALETAPGTAVLETRLPAAG